MLAYSKEKKGFKVKECQKMYHAAISQDIGRMTILIYDNYIWEKIFYSGQRRTTCNHKITFVKDKTHL